MISQEEKVPLIRNRRELQEHLKELYIIEPYFESVESYDALFNHLMLVLRGCFRIRACREFPIRFKITAKSEVHELQLKRFVINVAAWRPFINLYNMDALDDSIIINSYDQVVGINDYINENVITKLRAHNIGSTDINKSISAQLHNLRAFCLKFSVKMNLNFSIPMFIDLYQNDAEIRDLMECKFDNEMQPYEIEQKLDEYQNRFIEKVKMHPKCHLGVVLRANTGIKHKQLREFAVADGLKPTITGKTIPICNSNSTLIGGLNNPSTLYIAAGGARKSLVMNKTVMGKAGYFGKIVLLLTRSLKMSTRVLDCGTKHYVTYEVRDKKYLKKLDGKYMIDDSRDGELYLINAKRDKHLIGKTIKVRSIATCACEDGYVCPRCVGHTSVSNYDIADGVAAFESEEVTKHVSQNILSTKHLLNTNSEKLEWNGAFFKFFTIVGGEIYPKINDNEYIENVDDWAIYIDPESISKVEEMDDDSLYNTYINSGKFIMRNLKNPEIPDVNIELASDKEIYISPTALECMKRGKGYIKLKELDDDDKLFEIVIVNNELTKPLYDIMALINKDNKNSIGDVTIDTLCQKFLDLLIEANIPANVVASEMIINNLIHSSEDIYSRPDFSEEELEPYEINTVSRSLEHHSSPLIGLSFQNLKRQIISDEFYESGRCKPSYIDAFFNETVPTDNLKKYAKIINLHPRSYVS